MHQKEIIPSLIQQLETFNKEKIDQKVFIGFDGFVDNILRAVASRSKDQFSYFEDITSFAQQVGKAAGKSGQIELISQELKLGGNAPIMAYAMGQMGVENICMASLGHPDLHPVFKPLTEVSDVISICDPGMTYAFEFDDGKLIFSELTSFTYLDWNYLKKEAGIENITNLITQSFLVSMVDWVNLNHATDIWRGMLEEVVKPMNVTDKNYFFDIADPTKKSDQDIKEVIDLIGQYQQYGNVTLGVNENETRKLFTSILGKDEKDHSLLEVGKAIFDEMNVDILLVHPTDRTLAFTADGVFDQPGRVVKHPKISTGGGDNFNAGYCLGMLQKLSLPECMVLGMAASGAYVQNGLSANLPGLAEYLKVWLDELS